MAAGRRRDESQWRDRGQAEAHEEDVTTAPHPLWGGWDRVSPFSTHCLSHVLLFVEPTEIASKLVTWDI
jgi:hypothetical protein